MAVFGSYYGAVPFGAKEAQFSAETLPDSIALVSQNLIQTRGVAVLEQLLFATTANAAEDSAVVINDAMRLQEAFQRILGMRLEEPLSFSSNLLNHLAPLFSLREELLLAGVVKSQVEYNLVLATALAFSDIPAWALAYNIEDSAAFTDSLSAASRLYLSILDAFATESTVSQQLHAVGVVEDSASFADATTFAAQLQALLQDRLAFVPVFLSDGTQSFVGWAMNAANYATTQYDNFNFNSIAKVGDEYWAAASTGLYRLEGSTDAGSPIDWLLRTGKLRLGPDGQNTRVEDAYLTCVGDGRILVKTLTDDQTERWYEVCPSKGVIDKRRVKLGRGVSSHFWQFELSRIDGEELQVQNLELIPVVLRRRV